ncbi:MAG: MarR family transcriptional regulator [Vicinamibacterales bacterium]
MVRTLHEELQSDQPYPLEEAVHLSIVRTAAVLDHAFAQVLKPHGLTPAQYNVLRILRGAGDDGLCVYEVAGRMLRPVPDMPRMLDRLKQMRLIVRRRATEDRRMVRAHITPKGLALLHTLDGPIREVHEQRLAHMNRTRLAALLDTLDQLRNPET